MRDDRRGILRKYKCKCSSTAAGHALVSDNMMQRRSSPSSSSCSAKGERTREQNICELNTKQVRRDDAYIKCVYRVSLRHIHRFISNIRFGCAHFFSSILLVASARARCWCENQLMIYTFGASGHRVNVSVCVCVGRTHMN